MRIAISLLFAACASVPALAGIPEPDALLYGTVTLNGVVATQTSDVTVIAKIDQDGDTDYADEQAVGTYRMGDVLGADNACDGQDCYVLRIRLESLADGSAASPTAGRIGNSARIFVREGAGPEVRVADFPIADRGQIVRLNLSDAVSGACCYQGGCTSVTGASACRPYVCDFDALVPPSFAGCYGDADGNGIVNPGDRGFVSANIGQATRDNVCRFDMDGNGIVNAGDRGFVSANIGLCTPLPDWQNGSGLNHGVPDTRFGTATYQGDGTTCAAVTCPQ